MSARAVIAAGVPFSPREGSFADADVALDEIRSLPPPTEPLILRVTTTGGTFGERAKVEGDWLCERGFLEPARLSNAYWTFDLAAQRWARGRAWVDAWESCTRAEWLMRAADMVIPMATLVRAACACARAVLPYVDPQESRPYVALEAAESWASGALDSETVRRATRRAWEFSESLADVNPPDPPAYAASLAAGFAAVSVYTSASEAYRAAEYAATALKYPGESGRTVSLPDIVRAVIPLLEVLRGYVVPPERPPWAAGRVFGESPRPVRR